MEFILKVLFLTCGLRKIKESAQFSSINQVFFPNDGLSLIFQDAR